MQCRRYHWEKRCLHSGRYVTFASKFGTFLTTFAIAGGTLTVEMHQQAGDRDCGTEAIGGNHYGPVIIYMSKVTDATTADGSTPWFKVAEDGYIVANTTWGDVSIPFPQKLVSY